MFNNLANITDIKPYDFKVLFNIINQINLH